MVTFSDYVMVQSIDYAFDYELSKVPEEIEEGQDLVINGTSKVLANYPVPIVVS